MMSRNDRMIRLPRDFRIICNQENGFWPSSCLVCGGPGRKGRQRPGGQHGQEWTYRDRKILKYTCHTAFCYGGPPVGRSHIARPGRTPFPSGYEELDSNLSGVRDPLLAACPTPWHMDKGAEDVPPEAWCSRRPLHPHLSVFDEVWNICCGATPGLDREGDLVEHPKPQQQHHQHHQLHTNQCEFYKLLFLPTFPHHTLN